MTKKIILLLLNVFVVGALSALLTSTMDQTVDIVKISWLFGAATLQTLGLAALILNASISAQNAVRTATGWGLMAPPILVAVVSLLTSM